MKKVEASKRFHGFPGSTISAGSGSILIRPEQEYYVINPTRKFWLLWAA